MINMVTSSNGQLFIYSVEECILKAYQDERKNGIWTIGTGHTDGVKSGDKITRQQAQALLAKDLASAERAVNSVLNMSVAQHRFDMLISAVFNIGPSFINDPDMKKALAMGDTRGAAALFVLWSLNDGAILDGLLKRRAMEARIFQQGYTKNNLAWINSQIKS